jgi:hypothetical protein
MLWRLTQNAQIRAHATKAWELRMNDQLHLGRADLNPAGRFKRPMDVVEAAGIPIEAKFSILEAWEADERALQRAEDEGMGGGEHAHLQRVQEALSQLREMGAGA